MIFQHTHEKVMSGDKTATCRIWKPDLYQAYYNQNGAIETIYSKWKGQRIYQMETERAVQPGRGKKSIGRIKITYMQRVDVRKLSDDSIRKEGFYSRDEFMQVWHGMHKQNYDALYIEFELVQVGR